MNVVKIKFYDVDEDDDDDDNDDLDTVFFEK